MKLTTQSAVPVYTIAGSSTARPLPEWLARQRKRSLKQDPEYANRIELLQDFEFEEASQCVRVSDDGDWIMSTGTYKPQIHTHYLPHLSLSFARHTISLNTTFQLLSTDYSKSVHLQADRSIEFHTPQGCHYTMRLPRYGRDVKFDKRSAEILIPAVGVNQNSLGEVFRLNLDHGRYMRSYEVDVGREDVAVASTSALQGGVHAGSVNVASIAEESHNLLAFGTSLGTVEFWDSRARSRAGVLQPPRQHDSFGQRPATTALQFHQSGLTLATGFSSGLVQIYDLRSPVPLIEKDQGFGSPVQDLIFLDSRTASSGQDSLPKILSADKNLIRIWDTRQGNLWTTIEPAVKLHNVAWCRDSGMFLTANEGRQQHAFLIPQLGPAPRWCAFLDNLVEEMAEDPNDPNAFTTQKGGEVYDNYKFLTVPQLEALNLSHLIGSTSMMRPYMHGFFIAQRLYEEAKVISDPYVWEEQRAKRVREKIEKERESRIRGTKKVTAKVNRKLAEKLLEKEAKLEERRAQRATETSGNAQQVATAVSSAAPQSTGLLNDPRFAKIFQDEDFTIDETSEVFRSLNPSTKVDNTGSKSRGLTAVEEEVLDEIPHSSDASSSESDDAENERTHKTSHAKPEFPQISYKRAKKRPEQAEMRLVSSGRARPERDKTFGSRKAAPKKERVRFKSVGGEREVTFAPERKKKGQSNADEPRQHRDKNSRRSASGNVFRRM